MSKNQEDFLLKVLIERIRTTIKKKKFRSTRGK